MKGSTDFLRGRLSWWEATALRFPVGEMAMVATIAVLDGPDSSAAFLDELRTIQAELPATIRAAPNGPYLVTNAERLTSWLWVPLPSLR